MPVGHCAELCVTRAASTARRDPRSTFILEDESNMARNVREAGASGHLENGPFYGLINLFKGQSLDQTQEWPGHGDVYQTDVHKAELVLRAPVVVH